MGNLKVNDLVRHKKLGLCTLEQDESLGKARYWLVKQLKTGELYDTRHASNLRLVGRNFKKK